MSSPLEVGRLLGQITHEIGVLTEELAEADRAARRAKAEYERACAIAFRQSSGSVEARRMQVVELFHGLRLESEDAQSRVVAIKARISYAQVRIDVGRSYGAALRAEAAAVNTPWGEG